MLVKYIKYAVTFKEFCLLEPIFADFILFLFAVWVLPHTDSFTSKDTKNTMIVRTVYLKR